MTINLEKSLDIQAPLADIFAAWAKPETAAQLLNLGSDEKLELIEKAAGEHVSWRITGPKVSSSSTVRFGAAGDDGGGTRVTLVSHYPNGIGPETSLDEVTANMVVGLSNITRLLNGEPLTTTAEPTGYSEVTEAGSRLQQSFTSATEAWATSVNKTFQILSALAWWPWQVSVSSPVTRERN